MLLLISGTEDGRKLSEVIEACGFEVVISVSTVIEAALYSRGNTVTGRMDYDRLIKFAKNHPDIEGIVDASHPLSDLSDAVRFSSDYKIPYVRYGRFLGIDTEEYTNAAECCDIDNLSEYIANTEGNIMLHIGEGICGMLCKQIDDKSSLFTTVIKGTYFNADKLLSFGIPIVNIIETDGIDAEEEIYDTYVNCGIKTVVMSADNGVIGSYDKINAAKRAGAGIVILHTELLKYPAWSGTYEGIANEISAWRK